MDKKEKRDAVVDYLAACSQNELNEVLAEARGGDVKNLIVSELNKPADVQASIRAKTAQMFNQP